MSYTHSVCPYCEKKVESNSTAVYLSVGRVIGGSEMVKPYGTQGSDTRFVMHPTCWTEMVNKGDYPNKVESS